MSEWHKTGCVMCAQNCGLEVRVENNRMVRVRPDGDNPRSQGYACRKGLNVMYHQHHAQRLTHPLKRVGERFEKISWDQAINEIAARLRAIVDAHGPKAVAYMGGGGQGCHFEAAFGVRLIRALGSHYHYNALAQELTGSYWVWGRVLGRQNLLIGTDHHNTDMLVAVGWNGMMSHQMPQARKFLTRFAKDPDKTLVVIDPRRSETAAIANIHLSIRPGTDALLTRAMIAILLQQGWHDRDYIARHVSGFDEIEDCVKRIRERKLQFALLQCTSSYPTPLDQVGLNVIGELRSRFNCPIGLSDHSGTLFPGLAGMAKGIDILEVHVVLDRRSFGPDVQASVTVDDLGFLVKARDAFHAMAVNPVDKDEMAEKMSQMKSLFSKSVAPAMALPAGTILKAEMLTLKKPGTGIQVSEMENLIGRRLLRDVDPRKLLIREDFE